MQPIYIVLLIISWHYTPAFAGGEIVFIEWIKMKGGIVERLNLILISSYGMYHLRKTYTTNPDHTAELHLLSHPIKIYKKNLEIITLINHFLALHWDSALRPSHRLRQMAPCPSPQKYDLTQILY